MKTIRFLFLALMLTSSFALGQSKDFPNRPIKVIVLFGPGGTSDLSARYFGKALTEVLGQPVIVENRPGASGSVGVVAVKNAPADGYTVLVATNTPLSVNPIIEKKLAYDPIKDFKPISGLIRVQNVLVVTANSKLNSLADLVAAAKEQPNKLNVGTFSVGHQLTTTWFASLAGVKFTNIPYKDAGDIISNLMGGQLDFASVDMPAATSLLKSGKIRALAVSGEKRHAAFPDVPTIKEVYPDYASYSWISLYVRAETPDDVTAKLTAATQQILASPAASDFAAKVGGELMPLPPAAMQKLQRDELERFRRVAEAAGIAAQ